jgi:hypothetical protein
MLSQILIRAVTNIIILATSGKWVNKLAGAFCTAGDGKQWGNT